MPNRCLWFWKYQNYSLCHLIEHKKFLFLRVDFDWVFLRVDFDLESSFCLDELFPIDVC